MHPANQKPGKPDKLSQGAHKQTSYPRVQWGNTLDKKGRLESLKNNKNKQREQEQQQNDRAHR